jgi:hypothetical protein
MDSSRSNGTNRSRIRGTPPTPSHARLDVARLADHRLALAVVAEAARLQHRRQPHLGHGGLQLLQASRPVRTAWSRSRGRGRTTSPRAGPGPPPAPGARDAPGRALQVLHGCRVHVLELVGDGVQPGHEPVEHVRVVVATGHDRGDLAADVPRPGRGAGSALPAGTPPGRACGPAGRHPGSRAASRLRVGLAQHPLRLLLAVPVQRLPHLRVLVRQDRCGQQRGVDRAGPPMASVPTGSRPASGRWRGGSPRR